MGESKRSLHQWRHVGGIIVAFTTEGVMDDEDWFKMVEDLQTLPIQGYLGATVGTSEVSSTQRKAGAETMRNRGLPSSVVTDSRFVIGLVTAASWLGAKIKGFGWSDLPAAIDYLGVSAEQKQEIIDAMLEMRIEGLGPSANDDLVFKL